MDPNQIILVKLGPEEIIKEEYYYSYPCHRPERYILWPVVSYGYPRRLINEKAGGYRGLIF